MNRCFTLLAGLLLLCGGCAGGGIVEESPKPAERDWDTLPLVDLDSNEPSDHSNSDPSQFCYLSNYGDRFCRDFYDTSSLSQPELPIEQRLTGTRGHWCRLTKANVLRCWAQYQQLNEGMPLLVIELPLPDRRLGTLGFVSLYHSFYTYPSGEVWAYSFSEDVGHLKMMKHDSERTVPYADERTVEIAGYDALILKGKHLVKLGGRQELETQTDQTMHADLIYKHACTLEPEPKCLDQSNDWAVIDLPNFGDWVGARSSSGWSCRNMEVECSMRDQDMFYANEQRREICQPTVPESLFPRFNDWPARTPTCLWNAEGELFCFDFDEQRVDGVARVTQLFGAGGAALGPIREVSLGELHLCVLGEDGGVRCMGRNDHGELGLGTADDQLHVEPVDVVIPHDSPVEFIRTSGGRTCALHADDEVTCWGSFGYDAVAGPTLVPFETMERLEGEFLAE